MSDNDDFTPQFIKMDDDNNASVFTVHPERGVQVLSNLGNLIEGIKVASLPLMMTALQTNDPAEMAFGAGFVKGIEFVTTAMEKCLTDMLIIGEVEQVRDLSDMGFAD